MIAYKYVHPDRIDVLENGLIRFTQPDALNDPFETLPNLQEVKAEFKNIAHRAIERTRYKGRIELLTAMASVKPKVEAKLAQIKKDNYRKYAFLSLSKRQDQLLMWSHYADSHRGFVIGFDSNNEFFKRRKLYQVSSLEEVKYSAKRIIVPASALDPQADHSEYDLAEMFFFIKSDHWFYEEELRMIVNPHTADKIVEVKGGYNIYLFKFPPESLKETVFGYRMSRHLKFKLANVIASRYSNVELFEAKLSETEFGLDINPFTDH